ncbi:2-amino-4-hydroxy-6-hydroxymethyldihydropteridine diphosphokinase [Parablastomonas sp. CN1-191]|uniref:2-amino-4-hydroxy-6- hydroxymethyldihydropteridine diphosphokinase n=1 Tax=Parablastomonas sp. CN1-191 TaxID=3400908 RepID=UPI003BF78B6E
MERYLIALGSNRRHCRFGAPAKVLIAALDELRGAGIEIESVAATMSSAPIGPSRRRYANSAAIVRTGLAPTDLLDLLKSIETRFGRRRGGQRWSARTLDLDIVLWERGAWHDRNLTIPHVAFRQRRFVLGPASAIAPRWRDPITGLTLRQLSARAA